MNKKVIGNFIVQLRTEKSLTQEQLATKIKVPTKVIKKLEKGKYKITTELLSSLCKVFKLQWYELLNGYRGTEKEDINKGTIALLKISKKKKKSNLILKVCTCLVLILFSCTLMWLYANRDLAYELRGETDNFKYEHILFLRDNGFYFIMFGQYEIKNPAITKDSITKVSLMSDDRLIVSSNTFLNGVEIEQKGYDELFPKEVVKNIDKWYYEITYTIEGESYTDVINLSYEEI